MNNRPSHPKLSLIIPAYNEAGRVLHTIALARAYFSGQSYDAEIVVVDDGSRDGTADAVRARYPDVVVVEYASNRGKGYAMRQGVAVAHGMYCLVYDADGSTPIGEVDRVWPAFDAGASVVIGSRALSASDVSVRQPSYRRFMGRSYNRLLRFLRLTTFRDTQCGFKAFDARAREVVFSRLTIDGFGSDCEMLVVANLHSLTITEIPVRWINSAETRVRPVRHSLAMLLEALLIRLRLSLGRYR